ncbi:MAG: RHS repeat-associated core domain-containing protein [Planctomycetia bacterium]|nr:RHS repeat-associated core domain-containing protein [Planctomycetia bacterium]
MRSSTENSCSSSSSPSSSSSSSPSSSSSSGSSSSSSGDNPRDPVCNCCEMEDGLECGCKGDEECGCCDGAECNVTDEPIGFHDGKIRMMLTDIAMDEGGVRYAHKRIYNNIAQAVNGIHGPGWKTTVLPKMTVYTSCFQVVFAEQDIVNFDRSPDAQGIYHAQNGFPETMIRTADEKSWVVTRNTEKTWTFSNEEFAETPWGFLRSVRDLEGNETAFFYENELLSEVRACHTDNPDAIFSKCLFEYNLENKLAQIVLWKNQRGTLEPLKKVIYTYASSSGIFGPEGFLTSVQHKTYSNGNWIDSQGSAYRYYTENASCGSVGLLKMVFEPIEFASFETAFGANGWNRVDDLSALDFTSKYYEYDPQNRVVLERANRNRHVTHLEYTTYSESNNPNAAHVQTIQTGTFGERNLVFTNTAGKVLLREVVPPNGSADSQVYYFRYNSDGKRTHAYSPKAVLGYRLLGAYPTLLDVTLSPDEGKIEIREYGDGTTSPLKKVVRESIQEGTQGNVILLTDYTYEKRAVAGRTRWNLSRTIQYTNEIGTETTETQFQYAYYPNSLQISQRTTVLPDSATRVECYDVAGRNTWQRDELGIITYHEYDAILGLEVRTIQDVDTSKTSDFTTPVPDGWSTPTGAGKHLISDVEYDSRGRVTQALGAKNVCVNAENQSVTVRSARWTIYDDANHKIISANGFVQEEKNNGSFAATLVNPVTITLSDVSGRLLETVSARRISTSGKLAATDTFLQADYLSWSVNIYAGDQLAEKRDYFDIPASGPGEENVHYNATRYGYDTYGRRSLVISPDGTVTKTVFDWQNNPTQTWLGTSLSDLTLVSETLYGGEDGGCPTCTGTTAKPRLTIQYADADDMRITEYGYDWRGRRIHVHNEEDADGQSTYALTTYDNLDRAVKSERYLSLDPSPDRLLARTETFYDSRGNVWKTEQSVVNPANGTVQGKLLAQNWFDAAGRTIQSKPLGENRVTVTTYDSLGRAVSSSVQLDETIFEKTETTYDNLGHALQTAFSQRLANGTGFRTSYTANWFDQAGRSIASANYGALDTFTRPVTVPERSDTTLVTTTVYDETTGRVLATLDPANRETRTFTDALGRTVRTVSNFTDGTISAATPDCNVTVEYTYHPSGQASTMTVKNPVTGDQITRYAYTLGRLTQECYPDSTSPTDCVTYTYNRLGERTSKRDQNGTIHEYIYDNLGRILHDCVTQTGDGVDAVIRRISTTYTPSGQVSKITSYDSPDPNSGTLVNRVAYGYDSCGLLAQEYQNVDGSTAPSPYTGYLYDTTQSGGFFTKKLRPTGFTFPDGWEFFYAYDNTFDDLLNRPNRIYGTTITQVEYEYMGVQTPVTTKYAIPNLTLDYTQPGALDRFNRITQHAWKNASNQSVVEIHHAYDRSGNRLNRTDVVAGTAFNEAYQYDEANQLIDLQRQNNHEHFHYDSTGNWLAYSQNDTLQTRTHNAANEIVTLDGSDISIRTDASGNMTRIPNPRLGETSASAASFFYATRRFAAPRKNVSTQPQNLNLTYDAWNRLVRVTSSDGTTIATYAYDGLNRRILKTTPTETRRFYYNRNWQCLLETAENQPSIHYTWGLRYIDDLVCRHVGFDKIYSLSDPNWNVVALVNSAGIPVERYTYNAFGTPQIYDGNFTPRSSSNYAWTRTFTGQVLDHETNFMLYRNRFYHPTLGRFLTRDPIGYESDRMNIYRYVANKPLIIQDPSGTVWHIFGGCLAGGILSGVGAWIVGGNVKCATLGGCITDGIAAAFPSIQGGCIGGAIGALANTICTNGGNLRKCANFCDTLAGVVSTAISCLGGGAAEAKDPVLSKIVTLMGLDLGMIYGFCGALNK